MRGGGGAFYTQQSNNEGCERAETGDDNAGYGDNAAGDATTSRRTMGKREERRQRTRGDGASMGIEKQRQSREDERWRHRHNNQPAKTTATAMAMTTGSAMRRYHGYMAATALVLAAEVAVALIADDTDGGNSGVAIVGRASLTVGGGLIN